MRGENPERHLPGRCTFTITIRNSDNATESENPVGEYKFTRLRENINRLMYMDDIKLLAKNKRDLDNLNPD